MFVPLLGQVKIKQFYRTCLLKASWILSRGWTILPSNIPPCLTALWVLLLSNIPRVLRLLTCEVRPHTSFVYVCGTRLVPCASPHHTSLFKQSPKYMYVHPRTNPNNSTYSYRRVHTFVCTTYQTNMSYLTHQTNKSHSFNTCAREHVPSPALNKQKL